MVLTPICFIGRFPRAVLGLAAMPGVGLVILAKRALVVLLRSLAAAYQMPLAVNRDSCDADVRNAVRKVAVRIHPDKGGSKEDMQRLLQARDAWTSAVASKRGRGRPANDSGLRVTLPARQEKPRKGYRVHCEAVLLTYQGFPPEASGHWERLQGFVRLNFGRWKVRHWCATMETNEGGGSHIHLMLQFRQVVDWTTARFEFESRRPNASTTDYLGEGLCKKKMQESINRGMFYVFANKIGTQRAPAGGLCVSGNYFPAWAPAQYKYEVKARWAESLWRARKITHDTWEEYIFECRDNVAGRKRNLDAVRDRERELAEGKAIAETAKRLRSNPAVYKPFPVVPAAQEWLARFAVDALRYPILVVKGPSHCGKTEWAKSLFSNPLELKIGCLQHFPDAMREFDRAQHDGLILDDIRDMKFLTDHQHALQGKYDARVEFATTPGGTCAYKKYLYAVPTVATCNYSTANLGFLLSDDWLKHEKNRLILDFPDALGEAAPE